VAAGVPVVMANPELDGVGPAGDVVATVGALIADSPRRTEMATTASAALGPHRGAVDRALDVCDRLLQGRGQTCPAMPWSS
jgi:hypothetical protein